MRPLKSFILLFLMASMSIHLSAQSNDVKTIEPTTLYNTIKNSAVQLIDVRTPSEYQTGHIGNAVNINYYDQTFSKQVERFDKSKPVYVYCRSGIRGKYASYIFKKLGFKTIYNLEGGILNWDAKNLPLSK